ncbi:MAG: hypothetical protein ACRDQZ_06645 [Mycobacteriales bacterium]
MTRMTQRRPWLIPVIASVAAAALLVAGVVVWRMYSHPSPCEVDHRPFFCGGSPVYRLHPLRAELLWAASALLAVASIGIWVRQRRRPGSTLIVSG